MPDFRAERQTYFFSVLLLVCFAIITLSLNSIDFVVLADEGFYLKYGTFIADQGVKGFPKLFEFYTQDPLNPYPNPLRIGFIFLSAFWLKAFGYSFLGLAYLSLFSFLVFLCVSFYFSSKYFDKETGLLYAVLLAFSPLALGLARRALSESTVQLFMALCFWMFWSLIQARSPLKYAGFILTFSLAILMKETVILFSPVFAAYLAMHKFWFKKEVRLWDLLSISVLPIALVGAVYLAVAGPSAILQTIGIILHSPKTNPHALAFGQGPWFRYIIDFMLLSPWVTLCSVGFFFSYLSSDRRQDLPGFALVFAGLIFVLFNFFTKNVRYVTMLDIPMRLFTVLLVKEIVFRKVSRHPARVLALMIAGLALLDYVSFYVLFLEQGIYDPMSYVLLKTRRFIPF